MDGNRRARPASSSFRQAFGALILYLALPRAFNVHFVIWLRGVASGVTSTTASSLGLPLGQT